MKMETELTTEAVKALAGMILISHQSGHYFEEETLLWAAKQLRGDKDVPMQHIRRVMEAQP